MRTQKKRKRKKNWFVQDGTKKYRYLKSSFFRQAYEKNVC